MPEQVVKDLAAFEAALQAPRVLLFKHSPICPISNAARAEYEVFRLHHPDVPTLFVDVVSARPIARAIAQRCGVEHRSPQVILFEQGKATWHTSHDGITAAALEAAWAPTC